MSKQSRPTIRQARRPAPRRSKAKSRPSKKAKPKKRSWLAALFNSPFGVLLIGALLIFGLLMLVAVLPGSNRLLAGENTQTNGSTPALIAAPPQEAAASTPTSPPPTAARQETDTEEGPPAGAGDTPPWAGLERTPDGAYRETHVPILMYHYISVPPEDADAYRLDLSVTPEHFAEQMAWLDENGYTTITLYQLATWLAQGDELPERPVILTFDDGYRDNYENAFPILQEYGQTGTFFILTGPTEAGNPEYMSWDMLREMVRGGMDVEIHAHDHLDLAGQDAAYLELQVGTSAGILEERLGYRPRFLAYPGGSYDENTIQALKDANYWLGLTTRFGCLHVTGEEYELPRIRIRGEYNLDTFAWLLSSAFEDEEFCYGWAG